MNKYISSLSMFLIVLTIMNYGQLKIENAKSAPLKIDQPVTNSVIPPSTYTNNMPAGWVLVDTMGNSYGPASPTLNPLYFEPYAGVLAFVHRGGGAVGTTSGKIYYNYSTDFGATWTRTATAVNEGNTQWAGRYPSMAIANPTQGLTVNSTVAAFSWPELNPGAFGWLGYAADQPVGGNSPASGIDQGPPTYSSNMPTFVSYTTDNVFWLSDNQDNASLRFFRTSDFSTIDKIDPPEWSDAIFQSNGNITLGGATRPGITVVAEFGPFALQNPIQSGWTVGISKSTDEGTTWSAFNVCDFRTIPVLAAYDRLFDAKKNDAFVGFTGDIILDDEGKAHLVVVVTDTVPNATYPNNYGTNAIVELIETSTGWDAKIIYSGIDNDIFTLYNNADNNPGIGQMSEGAFIAVSEDGNFYLAQWIDKHPTVSNLCAVYYSYRTKTTNWSPKALLTLSNTHNFNGAHLAPKVRKVDANKYMTFHMLWYQLGTDVSPIVTTAPNGAYVKALETTVGSTSSVTVTSPNGGESWQVGSQHNITWSSSNINNVKLEYTTNTGSSWSTIIASTPAISGQYTWTVPNTPSTQCKVRVSNSLNISQNDVSNSMFSILGLPSITLTLPNGGEIWQVGTSRYIQWSSSNVTNVKLEYSTNNGSAWTTIVASLPSSNGQYAWTIPNTPSSQCLVRVSDASNSAISDVSNNAFTINNPSVTVVSPNGGENWQVGTIKTIQWSFSDISTIKIEYSTNNGSSWFSITSGTPASAGQYSWTIPNTPSSLCKVRISDAGNSSITNQSASVFSVYAPSLFLVAPNGGEEWNAGTTRNIQWSYIAVENVKIEYTTNNGLTWSTIISSTNSSTGVYAWSIPNTPSTQCKVRISDASNSSINDLSNSVFTISASAFYAIITADSIWLDPDYDGLVLKQVSGNLSVGQITDYEWYLNNSMVAQGVNPIIELRTGNNFLKLKVTNNLGLTAYDSVKIKVYGAKSKTNGGIYSGISQIGNLFYVTSLDKGVYRFDSSGVMTPPYMTGGSIQSTMAISNKNMLYVGSDDTRLYAFDVSLNSVWDKSMGGVIKASPSITSDGNTIYIGTNNGYLKALDANNGNPKWTFISDGGIISSPTLVEIVDSNQTLVETIIYFGTENGIFYALKDKGTSYEQFWSLTAAPDSGIVSSPAISDDGMIYFGSKNGYVYRVKWDGEQQTSWKKYTGGKIVSSPLIGKNDLVYVISESGFLYGYEKEFTFESSPKKQFNIQWGVNGTPSIGRDGNLYVGCNNGTFYKLQDTEGSIDLSIKWFLTTNSGIESPVLSTESGLVVLGCTNGDIYIMKDLSVKEALTENLNFAWPTFKGNNKRNKVTRIVTSTTGVDNVAELPNGFKLLQNYPNPFNPSTEISYQIPANSFVTLKVFDMVGNEVAVLVKEEKPAGYHTITFNAENISTGVYFYRLQAGEFVSTKKLILMK